MFSSSIVIGIFFGVIMAFMILREHYYLCIISLLVNIIIYYIINRFLFPKVLYSPGYLKAYFLGVVLVVLIFELVVFLLLLPIDDAKVVYLGTAGIYNYSPEELFAFNFSKFNMIFLALMSLKMVIFLLSWFSLKISIFVFNKYKAYRINDFTIPKQPSTKKVKYIGFALGVFFTLSNIDILPLMIDNKDLFPIPILDLCKFVYQSFYIESFDIDD